MGDIGFNNRPRSLNNAATIAEPSFEQKYPEGRERLLALAESSKCHRPTSANQTPAKPKMGLKDVRHHRTSTPSEKLATGSSLTPSGQRNGSANCSYASEQSLPDKFAHALKGAFRGGKAVGGAVAADDVLYFSSSSASTTSYDSNNGANRRPNSNNNNNNNNANDVGHHLLNKQRKSYSKSIEKLDQTFGAKFRLYQSPHQQQQQQQQQQQLQLRPTPSAVDRAQNLTKVKQSMNLEDLRKLYRSMPDCSTPCDDDYDRTNDFAALGSNMAAGQTSVADRRSTLSIDHTQLEESELKTDRDSCNQTKTCVLSVDNSENFRDFSTTNGCSPRHCQHKNLTHSYFEGQREIVPSGKSSTTTADGEYQDLSQQTQINSSNNNINFRDSCGSPTDSGYRSVPRDDETPTASMTDGQSVAASTAAVVLALGAANVTPTVSYVRPPISCTPRPEQISCNIVIDPNCSTKSTGVGLKSRVEPQRRSKSKSHSRNACNGGQTTTATSTATTATTATTTTEETGNGVAPCHSPYSSDLSSPNYGTSSSGASSLPALQQQKMDGQVVFRKDPHVRCSTGNVGGHVGSFDTLNTNVSLPEEFSLERCPKLMDLDRVPWSEKDVVTVLQRGRTRQLVNHIAIDVVPRLAYLLQRPLVRVARETLRLCQRFNKCSKTDLQCASKMILPSLISESCQKAALQAVAMYTMGGDSLKQSKSQRAGLRGFSVGRFQRWMCDAQLSICVHDQAAVFLAAVLENLVEEIVLQSMPTDGAEMLTAANLDASLANNVELWGLLQPYSHLICSRTANGILALPHQCSLSRRGSTRSVSCGLSTQVDDKRFCQPRTTDENESMLRTLEQCLLATCVGNAQELGELIKRVLSPQIQLGQSPCLAALLAVGKQAPPIWSKEAVHTLFYFMRCSQLEHADNPHVSPPSLVLAHERPYLVLPPLIEWLRVSQAHCEHRQGLVVDTDDVLQASRILLPGLDCPPRMSGVDDCTYANGRQNQSSNGHRLKLDLALKMLTSGQPDLIASAVALLGSQGLDVFNDQGLTPLMCACQNGDELAARALLDAGANPNLLVPSTHSSQQKSPILSELSGWGALTFAVSQRHFPLCQLLLDHGASAELSTMCTETPLQLAAMMGHLDLVNLLVSKGADPFHATSSPDAGFKQRGCASALSLAAAHGHRTVVQALMSRRRGRSEEVLSLEDFLAEGVQGKADKRTPATKPVPQVLNNSGQQDSSANWLGKLTKSQQKILQEAMYQAAESGHIDITMDLRHFGVPWNVYVWTQTLATAHELKRKALVQLLLSDFMKHRLDEVSQEFIEDCLPLLFEIFRHSKNDVSTGQLAEIFAHLYGDEPIPPISGSVAVGESNFQAPRIDAKYVNNPDLSDVQFLIDDQIFYGHKIVLINASDRFKKLLQDGSTTVEITGVRYEVFQMLMEFLYNGKPSAESTMDLSVVLQLLCAANEFDLKHLRLYCESQVAKCLDAENCIDLYQFAARNENYDLLRYCEGYFLQNLPILVNRVDGYRRIMSLTNQKLVTVINGNTFDLLDSLLQTLACRLDKRVNCFQKRL